ncbi:hypothetical protein PsorP6_000635 [Peronosclerospora sorghi]|uniref:Uncharacterized protein n=1 Tax=Peronosclerospora sorghi TaxID=230839 RepID=A0ACC0WQ54_9STRA|nr:hypothetical protein PsorP6_000635 [Peronosclerospora sorghi]
MDVVDSESTDWKERMANPISGQTNTGTNVVFSRSVRRSRSGRNSNPRKVLYSIAVFWVMLADIPRSSMRVMCFISNWSSLYLVKKVEAIET